jgi:hypothetical protein
MTFPPEDLCFPLPDLPEVEDICLPGGICLSYVWDGIGKIPSVADISMDFYSQIGPALTPLIPLFNILDTVLAIFRCVKAIPDAITSLDPSELLKCLPALAKLVDQLLKLIPQLSIPKMVKVALKNMAKLLRSIASEITYIQSQLQRIADEIDRAAELQDVKMNGFLVCAQQDAFDTLAATGEALKGLGRIVLLLNVFIGLIGAEEIPCFGSLVSENTDNLDAVIDLLTTLAELLDTMSDAIPDPDLALTLALGDLQC